MTPLLPAKSPYNSLRHPHSTIPDSLKVLPGALAIAPRGGGGVNRRPDVRRIHDQAVRIARVDLPVLLVGGTGPGKRIVARLIHDLSPRRDGYFQEIRCADFREDVLERELFGSSGKDGSGLGRRQVGRLNACRGGTLLLDEITALPWRLQARLVDVLDGHPIPTAGDHSQASQEVRILATIREDAAKAVARGKLRSDLYYRLQCLTLRLAPLRERKLDPSTLLQDWITRNSSVWRKAAPEAAEGVQQSRLRYYTRRQDFWKFTERRPGRSAA